MTQAIQPLQRTVDVAASAPSFAASIPGKVSSGCEVAVEVVSRRAGNGDGASRRSNRRPLKPHISSRPAAVSRGPSRRTTSTCSRRTPDHSGTYRHGMVWMSVQSRSRAHTGLRPDTKSGKPRPSFLDVPSRTLPTVELLVGSVQAKTYGVTYRC